jgi:peptide chain release factor 1
VDLLAKLNKILDRNKNIETALSAPDVVSDMDKFTKLNKEYSDLKDVVVLITNYRNIRNEISEYEEILKDKTSEADLKELAETELPPLKRSLPDLEHEIKIALLPKDKADDKNVILELRAGTGGDEAALFTMDMFKMYSRYAEQKGWKVEVLEQSTNDLGGAKEIIASVKGENVYSRLKFESGTHRVQRVPQTETQGRVHTSAITVAILPEMQEIDVDINPADLRIDTFRASGAGGQHVNTTDSAIRVTHVPTGTVAECQDERSQHKNKAKALKILYARVYEAQQKLLDDERAQERKAQVGTGDRSERIRTYNYPQGRVTDHRINTSFYNLPNFMANADGLEDLIDGLHAEDQAIKLANLSE